MKFWCLYILVILTFACCSNERNPDYLPKATGKPGDILIIMDSVQWKGDLGKHVKSVFASAVPGMPQPEPMFNILFLNPSREGMLHQIRNVVFVFTLDQKTSGSRYLRKRFSEETINKIQSDTAFHLSTQEDEFAKGQHVMYLFGATEESLKKYLTTRKQSIIDFFNKMERERLLKNMPKSGGVAAFLNKDQKIDIRVPGTYKLADRSKEFVWFRQIGPNTDKDIWITWKPYTSEYQLSPDSLLRWRDDTLRKYIFEDPEKPNTYLVTETVDGKVQARQLTFNNKFSMELRGLWRTNHRTMGGPFVSYGVVDEGSGLLYYIEGFAYNPGKDKREMIRELETILWTFKTSGELSK